MVDRIAFIGFGEAAEAFTEGWAGGRLPAITAYDIKTDAAESRIAVDKRADYQRAGISGADRAAEAVTGAEVVFSLVTADQALEAAKSVAGQMAPGTLYLDCNSCAPDTKRAASRIIDGTGGRYVDVAVMAPVHPKLHRTPLLISGPHAEVARTALDALEMSVEIAPGEVGRASSIKMIRSVMVKGLEALVAECVLAGRRAGVDDVVLASLEASYPGFGWTERAGYMLERMTCHGVRRAAEMREVALTVDQLGLFGRMARATVGWQQQIGDLGLKTEAGEGYDRRADAILRALDARNERRQKGERGVLSQMEEAG